MYMDVEPRTYASISYIDGGYLNETMNYELLVEP